MKVQLPKNILWYIGPRTAKVKKIKVQLSKKILWLRLQDLYTNPSKSIQIE
jgi:hypothetical protein